MSLRDQLLKAGLVSKKQAKQAESQAKLQSHQAKKNKAVAEELDNQRQQELQQIESCLLYTSPSPRDLSTSRMPSSA